MEKIRIGTKEMDVPIIQGGMGIGISRCKLAGAVAKEGGMGVLSTAQIGYDYPGFKEEPEKTSLSALPDQIRKAKELSNGNGLIGVNIMAVTQLYKEYVETACKSGVDAIISGAGLPSNLPKYVEGWDVKIAPIVSSEKSARVILKYWDKKYHRTADFIVIEGMKAGGHLGFSKEELMHIEDVDYDSEIKKIIAIVQRYEEQYQHKIPVFVAGGIFDSTDFEHAIELGADGIQVGSRFVATWECDASREYKKAYIDASIEDIVIIDSPVGMPGRAIKNNFVKMMEDGNEKIDFCYNCLKACNPKTAKYCISKSLIEAVNGNIENGLIFCGSRVGEITEIVSVKEVIEQLLQNHRYEEI